MKTSWCTVNVDVKVNLAHILWVVAVIILIAL